MNLDFSPVINSPTYEKDKKKLSTSGNKRTLQMLLILIAIIVPLLWPVLAYVYIRWHLKWKVEYKQRCDALREFAGANKFVFTDNMGKPIEEHRSQEAYNLPFKVQDILNANELEGEVIGYPFVYSMSTVVSNKTNQGSSQHSYNLFTVKLPVELPRVFINSKTNNLKAGFDAKAVNFKQAEDHHLEGDFPAYYTVRIEENEQIDMYTILTPEVMDTLKRNNKFDVWLNDDQLTLITFGDLDRYFAATPMVFENAFVLMGEIDRIARALRGRSH